MRIALDATYSVGQNLSGVGVYSREILARLPVAHPDSQFLFCYRPHRLVDGLRGFAPPNVSRTLLWKNWPLGTNLFHALNQRVDSRKFRRVVTTFHDLFVITGEYSTPEFRARFAEQARIAARRSDLIIAVSRFTADQVESLLKVPRSRIRIIHHGATPGPLSELSSQTILFVGAIQKRKNILRLLRAFERTASGWKLVLAGSAGYEAASILDAIERSPRRADIEVPGYVTAETLEELYSRASIFAFPSLDEGFGMPVLDAMARGIPVLTSNRSALAEISGEAAITVDPEDVEALTESLRTLTEGEQLRKRLRELGLSQSERFQWGQAAKQTWDVYKELL